MSGRRKLDFLLVLREVSSTTTRITAWAIPGQTGPESPGDLNRGHPEQGDTPQEDDRSDESAPKS